MFRSKLLALAVGLLAIAPAAHAGEPVETDLVIRPGSAFTSEFQYKGAQPPRQISCTLSWLVTDGEDVYVTTSGHCYAGTADHPGRTGFENYRSSIVPALDDAYSAVDCQSTSNIRYRVCSSGKRIGKFVYALNNAFSDPIDRTVNGAHAPGVPIGDFGVIRLIDEVRYDPAMCLFGGPTGLYTGFETDTVLTRLYGQGFGIGYNMAARSAILPGTTGVASVGTPSPWQSRYTVTASVVPDGGGSGGPLMTADGRALAVQGGVHYLDRLDTNLERAGEALGKTFTLLTAPLVENAPPVGTDPACTPPKTT